MEQPLGAKARLAVVGGIALACASFALAGLSLANPTEVQRGLQGTSVVYPVPGGVLVDTSSQECGRQLSYAYELVAGTWGPPYDLGEMLAP